MVVVKDGKKIKVANFDEFIEILGKKVNPEKENILAKHFGALKRGYDGVQYQREARGEWN